LNSLAAQGRIALELGVLVVLALLGAVACGGSSAEVANANGLIAFARMGEIYGADGSGERRLTRSRAKDIAPAGSPDGRRIAFASDRDGELQIYTMNADGSGQRRLTRKSANAFPAWSPDGRRIAFESKRDGSFEIYLMNADGREQRRLRQNGGGGGDPVWSPDGASIAFVGNSDIYLIQAEGGGLRRLTRNPRDDEFPGWLPARRK
jgi:Tol biopolymer transport system component